MKYLKLKEYLKVAAFLLVANILCACSEDKPEGYYELESPYTVIDTGIKTVPRSKQKIYWLDNNTFLFYALSKQGEGLHLYYWPEKELNFIHPMKVSYLQNYCYTDGVLWVDKAHLQKNMDGHFKIHLVNNDQGRFVVMKKEESDVEKTFFRDIHCLGREKLKKMDKWPLDYFKEFGFFAYRSKESDNKVVIESKGDSRVVNILAYDADKFSLQNLGYFPHLKKYLFYQIASGTGYTRDDPKHYQFSFLNGEGVMEKPFQLQEPWDKNGWLKPTKAGYLVGGIDRRFDYDFENKRYANIRGCFLKVGDGRFDFIEIIKGVSRSTELSPNGCYLALDHKYYKEGSETTIKIVNLCEKEIKE
ncbi:MAG TPA: hypothetical protein VIN71_10905 [Pseudomonadales bacterium]